MKDKKIHARFGWAKQKTAHTKSSRTEQKYYKWNYATTITIQIVVSRQSRISSTLHSREDNGFWSVQAK